MTAITASSTDSPAPGGQVWADGSMLHPDAQPHEVGQALRGNPQAHAWMLLPRERSDALNIAAEAIGLDTYALEDVTADREPMKLEWLGSTMVAVTALVSFDAGTGEVTILPVSILATSRSLILLADPSQHPGLAAKLTKPQTTKDCLSHGVPAALHAVLDYIVDGHVDVLSQLEDAADLLSEELFADRPLARADQLRAFRLRRSIAQVRRVIIPMRDIAASLANAAARANRPDDPAEHDAAEQLLGMHFGREFADVADHAEHSAASADSLRDVLSSMYETNLALSDVHLNQVMKKLAGWGAIIAVPTLITGFMGMNVPYPGFGTTAGWIVSTGLIVIVVVLLYNVFRKSGWL